MCRDENHALDDRGVVAHLPHAMRLGGPPPPNVAQALRAIEASAECGSHDAMQIDLSLHAFGN